MQVKSVCLSWADGLVGTTVYQWEWHGTEACFHHFALPRLLPCLVLSWMRGGGKEGGQEGRGRLYGVMAAWDVGEMVSLAYR